MIEDDRDQEIKELEKEYVAARDHYLALEFKLFQTCMNQMKENEQKLTNKQQ